jgi:sugar fermentation stimulation protein A
MPPATAGVRLYTWAAPLLEGTLVRRYERFVAEVRLGRRVVRAHCVNPGRMEGLVRPGARVWLSQARADRALPYTWELMELDGLLVGVNTIVPNRLVRAAVEAGLVRGLKGVERVVPEQAFGRGHRVDLEVHRGGEAELVEVKNCHLVYPDGRGYFPDSSSARAVAHAEALGRQARRGVRCHVVFTLQRADALGLRPSPVHAPDFVRALRAAARAGVRLHALRLLPSLEGIDFDAEVPVELEGWDVQEVARWSAALDAHSGWVRRDGKVAGGSALARGASPSAARP